MSWFTRAAKTPPTCRFETLVRPHLERLHRLAWRFTQSREDAEDLVQTLLIKLIPQVDKLAAVEMLGPWLARSLYHLYVDQTSQRRRADAAFGTQLTDEEALEGIIDEVSDTPEQALDRQRHEHRLEQALASLSVEHRALIAWHDIEGYTLDELSNTLGVPIGTLKSRLHRGRAQLRNLLMEPSGGAERVPDVRIAI